MIAGLEERLASLCSSRETTTYGTLARDLGLDGPGTIARLTTALEALMAEDAARGRPLRAALCTARGTTLPGRGFFDKAVELGFDVADPADFAAAQLRQLHSGSAN